MACVSQKIQHLESQLVRQVAAAERGAEEQRGKAEEQWYKVEERLSKVRGLLELRPREFGTFANSKPYHHLEPNCKLTFVQ